MWIDLQSDLSARVPPSYEDAIADEDADGDGPSRVSALAFDPSGRSIAVGLREHAAEVLVYDLGTCRLIEHYPITSCSGEEEDAAAPDPDGYFAFYTVTRCAFSPDGRSLAVLHGNPNNGNVYDFNLQVFDRRSGAQVLGVGPRDSDGPGLALGASAFAFRPDGGAIAVASYDGGLCTWELGTAPGALSVRRAPIFGEPVDVDVPPVLSVAILGADRLALVRDGALEVRDPGGAPPRRVDLGIPGEDLHLAAIHAPRPDRLLVPMIGRSGAAIAIVDLVGGSAEALTVRRIEVAAEGVFDAVWLAQDGASILWASGDPYDGGGGDLSLRRQSFPGGALREVARRPDGAARSRASAIAVSPEGARVARAVGSRIGVTRLVTR